MCIFTHFAAGALVGGATHHVGAGIVAGLLSHAVLDMPPHYDFPNWRIEIAWGLVPLVILLASPFVTAAALAGGLGGCLPDLENLLWKIGKLERRRMIFPSHTGLLPHGRALGRGNLWVQGALAAACLGALALITPSPASAAPVAGATPAPSLARPAIVKPAAAPRVALPGSTTAAAPVTPERAAYEARAAAAGALFGVPTKRLVSGDANATVVQFDFPVDRAPADWASLDPATVLWAEPGPVVQGAHGEQIALPPDCHTEVAVSTPAAPSWRVQSVVWWREPSGAVDPASLVTLTGPAIFRDVPVVTVAVTPVAQGGGLLARLVLEIDHAPAGRPAACLAAAARAGLGAKTGAAARPGGAGAAFGAGTVLNPDLFTTLSAGSGQLLAQAHAKAADLLHPFHVERTHWVRIDIQQTGVYKLTGYDLERLGVPVEQVDETKLRLYKGGGLPLDADPGVPGSWQPDWVDLKEVAIAVQDDDGVWDSAASILFYGVGEDAWHDRLDPNVTLRDPAAARLDHFEHPYANAAAYWLTWENLATPSPLPGAPRRIQPQPAPANGVTPVTIYRDRIHREESYEDALGRIADNWLWDSHIGSSREFPFTTNTVVPDSSATFVADVAANRPPYIPEGDLYPCGASAWLNADSAERAQRQWTPVQQDTMPRVTLVARSHGLVSGANRLVIKNDLAGVLNALDIMFDSFDILYWAQLTKSAGHALEFAHWADQVAAPGTAVDLRLTLPDASPVTIWDVTDPLAPIALAGTVEAGPPATVTLGLSRDPGSARHFIAFAASDPMAISFANLARRYPEDLRGTLQPADWVVIYHPAFFSAAEALATFRAGHLPGVAQPVAVAVNEESIYDNFSGGMKDPLALRNFLKWYYQQSAGRLAYVCLLGDASHDYRNYLGHDPNAQLYDFLPTVVRTYFPRRAYVSYATDPYATDDGLVSFDSPPSRWGLDAPDLACGRLTVRSAGRATATVDQLERMATAPEPGTWRNRVVLAADDLVRGKTIDEDFHTKHAEVLANSYLPESLEVDKLYMIDYPVPPGSTYKPAARARAREVWNEGLTFFHFIGHGSANQLADEQLFMMDDVLALTNGARRGMFLAFSCDVGVFDSPDSQSMGELFVEQAAGGAIASIAASKASWIIQNEELSSDFYYYLYPGRRVDPTVSPGRALMEAKIVSTSPDNSQTYQLFCDPAFVLPQPATGVTFAAASADTLRGGSRATVVVPLAAAGLAPGTNVTYDLSVEESAQDKSMPVPYKLPLEYSLPGAEAYHGTGFAVTDPLRIAFKVPVQLRYGNAGRVRVILDGPDGAVAGAMTLPIVTAPTSGGDVAGPAIHLAFADDRYRACPGARLDATITDSSGVNILGTQPSNSVLYEIDNTGFMTNVSQAFQFDPGSYTSGHVGITLPPGLALGAHKLAMYASDVLGNVGTDTLSFQMIASCGAPEIAGTTLFPNPTPGPCRLVCELSQPMQLDWSIYTVAGRLVRHETQAFATAGRKILPWDGRDAEGGEIANGVYLYVLRGSWTGDGGHDITQTGRIVIMK